MWVGGLGRGPVHARDPRRARRRGLRHPPGLAGAPDHRRAARDGVGVTALRLGLLALLAGAIAVAAPGASRPTRRSRRSRRPTTSSPPTRRAGSFTGPERAPALLHRLELDDPLPDARRSSGRRPTSSRRRRTPGPVVELRLDGRVVQRASFGAGDRHLRGRPGPAAVARCGAAGAATRSRRGCTAAGRSPPGACPTPNAPHIGLDTLLAQDDPPAGARAGRPARPRPASGRARPS